ncbi:MAG: alpha/beta hydrolase [Lachnospiraceae bacterium]|nr:alpha/beta hydrolase [Lachnospiraceae bacterium]
MPLDPQVAAHYGGRRIQNVLGVVPIDKVRAAADVIYNDKHKVIPEIEATDFTIPGEGGEIPVRLYQPGRNNSNVFRDEDQSDQPNRAVEKEGSLPLILYFHGGAFMMHNIASHDSICRRLSRDLHCMVLSVEYRLAPEHPYPAALHDAWAALCWASDHASEIGADPGRLCTAGDSSGATLCAALNWYSMDHQGPAIYAQFLYYGLFGAVSIEESETVKAYGNGEYVLPKDMLLATEKAYLGGQDIPASDAYCFPGRRSPARTNTHTLVVVAEYDPLRADGEAFAAALKAAGSPVTLFQMTGMMHGFMMLWEEFDRASEAFEATRTLFND